MKNFKFIYSPFISDEKVDEELKNIIPSGNQDSFVFKTLHEELDQGLSVQSTCFSIRAPSHLYKYNKNPILGIFFSTKNNLSYKINGNEWDCIKDKQFNLLYIPAYTRYEYIFDNPGFYNIFFVTIPVEYLLKKNTPYPVLANFLKKIKRNKIIFIRNKHFQSTPEMLLIIENILSSKYQGAIRKIFLEIKVRELIMQCFVDILNTSISETMIKLRTDDIEKIETAQKYILEHMDSPLSLIDLAHEVGLNDFKLKKGFKQIYGTTVFNFLYEERMKKAMDLLLNSELPISEITVIVGYKNLSNFTAAFKKKYGCPPSAARSK